MLYKIVILFYFIKLIAFVDSVVEERGPPFANGVDCIVTAQRFRFIFGNVNKSAEYISV